MHDDEHMDGLRSLAGGLAHDFNNIFMAISGNAELARMELPEGAMARECLDDIVEATRRGVARANEMMVYAGRRPMEMEPVDLGSVVTERVDRARARWSDPPEIELHIAQDLPPIDADPRNIACSIDAILESALAALPPAGTATVTVHHDEDGAHVATRLTFP